LRLHPLASARAVLRHGPLRRVCRAVWRDVHLRTGTGERARRVREWVQLVWRRGDERTPYVATLAHPREVDGSRAGAHKRRVRRAA